MPIFFIEQHETLREGKHDKAQVRERMMLHLDDKQKRFLAELAACGGSATSKELGGYTKEGNQARRMCSLRGLAQYDGKACHSGIWSITDDGRKALKQNPGA